MSYAYFWSAILPLLFGGCAKGTRKPDTGTHAAPSGAPVENTVATEYLGRTHSGTGGTVRVRLRNGAVPRFVALVVRTDPGMWLRPPAEHLYMYRLRAGEVKTVEAPYAFSRMSPEAQVRTIVGIPEERPDGTIGVPIPLLVRIDDAGDAEAASDFLGRFDSAVTKHLTLYAVRASPGARDLGRIGRDRERAVAELVGLLDVAPPPAVRLVLYPDSASKTADTRHIGSGWAFGTTIVEIYNDSARLDAYHELTHIIAARLGGPPALFDEGLATYASERFGEDALRLLGWPATPVDRASCLLLRSGGLTPLAQLIEYGEIGPEESRPRVAYPQAASFVKFLLEHHGQEKFREAYRTLVGSEDSADRSGNLDAFQRIFGASLADTERRWLVEVARIC